MDESQPFAILIDGEEIPVEEEIVAPYIFPDEVQTLLTAIDRYAETLAKLVEGFRKWAVSEGVEREALVELYRRTERSLLMIEEEDKDDDSKTVTETIS